MIAITRTTVMLCIAALAMSVFLPATPASALSNVTFISADGDDDNPCSASAPCQTLIGAYVHLATNGQIMCYQGSAFGSITYFTSMTIDCPGVFLPNSVNTGNDNSVVKIRNLTFNGQYAGPEPAISIAANGGGGALILENCVFENFATTAIQIATNGSYNVVLKDTRMSNNASALLLKPAAGGRIKATFDHVTITGNNGGGIKADATNGAVNLDITDSEISNNAGNGINLVSGGGNQNMANLSRTVIVKNGTAGLQANGATSAALVDTTLFDSNASGATTLVNGGRIFTYGNNRIVGGPGSGFTGPAVSQ